MQYKHDLEVTVLLTTAANHMNPLHALHCIMHHFVLCDVEYVHEQVVCNICI